MIQKANLFLSPAMLISPEMILPARLPFPTQTRKDGKICLLCAEQVKNIPCLHSLNTLVKRNPDIPK